MGKHVRSCPLQRVLQETPSFGVDCTATSREHRCQEDVDKHTSARPHLQGEPQGPYVALTC